MKVDLASMVRQVRGIVALRPGNDLHIFMLDELERHIREVRAGTGTLDEFADLYKIRPDGAPAKAPDAREETMFLDASGEMICLGDVVRAPIGINQGLHGIWGDYRVRKAPGGYVLSYLRSEKGQILPEGYTGGYMGACLPDEDETDAKTLVFTQVPIKVTGWRIIREGETA